MEPVGAAHPVQAVVGGWTDLLVQGKVPSFTVWVTASAWALAALAIG